jgi:polysaccharide biosynthesis protein PslJ
MTSREQSAMITAPLVTIPEADPVASTRRADAVTLLTLYVFLLMAIPSSLVVGALGAAGAPAAIFAAVMLAWYLLARHHPAQRLDRGRQPVRAVAILFACSIIASYISVNRVTLPVLEENGADRGLVSLAGWMGVLLLAADGIDRLDRLTVLFRRIVLGATAMAVLGIAEFITGHDFAQYISIPGLSVQQQVTDLIYRDGLPRVMATAAQPLEFAAVLAMCLPLAIHQARFAPPQLRARRWIQVALIAATMPMTVSRSAIFGLIAVCVVLIPTWSRRDRRRAYLLLVTAPILGWLAKPSLLASFVGLFGQIGSDQSSKSRLGAYSEAAPYIAHHPWLGLGFGTFFPQIFFFVDNQYLSSLIGNGVIGLLALIALFVTGWCTARSVRHATADARTRDLAQSLAASMAAAAVCFATFDALWFGIAAGLCFLLLGSTGALWRLTKRRQSATAARAADVPAA